MYCVPSGYIDHRIDSLLKTSYWYQVFWVVETLDTCKFFIYWYIVKIKSMSHALISLAFGVEVLAHLTKKVMFGFCGVQSELTEVFIVDIFLFHRDYLSMSSTRPYIVSKLFSSCPFEIIFHIKRLKNPEFIKYNI